MPNPATATGPSGYRLASRMARLAVYCLAVIAITCGHRSVSLAGQENILRDQDVVLVVDSRWPGNAYGGYFPLRIRLSNIGPPRDLTLIFENRDGERYERVPEVRRTVHIEQQATINFTLSVPVVSRGSSGVLRVVDSALGNLEGLESRHEIPSYGGSTPRTSLLVISSTNMDDTMLQPFEDAAATECSYLSGLGSGGGGGYTPYYSGRGAGSQVAEKDHVVVQPTQNLPVNWIDYSGVDLVAVAWPDWTGKLSTGEREAILKWTATGGVLILYGTGQPASKLDELNRTLQLTASEVAGWVNCEPDNHRETNVVTSAELRSGSVIRGGVPPGMPSVTVTTEGPGADKTSSVGWKIDSDTFSHRDWSLGRIYVFPRNPFPGSASDWAWWLVSVPQNQTQWPRKYGMTSRDGTREFLNFLIPGVGSVPVFAFLTLITLFTLVIGPLNYYWLHKRRRLAAMVFTVPLIAAVTCVLLFSYSLVADGFSIRSRIASFTWLDQQRKSAVSASRLCLYAPFAPSAGLTFSPECAVFPIWPQAGQFENGTLNWSGNDQRLSSGWFRSQTWTQFQTLEYRDERGRLDFTPPSDPNATTLAVSNGLTWDLQFLAIDTTGNAQESKWFVGENIPAGSTAQLQRATPQEVDTQVQAMMAGREWKFPDGLPNPDAIVPMFGPGGRYRGYGIDDTVPTTLSQGLVGRNVLLTRSISGLPEADLLDWREGRNSKLTQPHPATKKAHFWAICRKNPGIQTGVKNSVDRDSLHILQGTF